ncbi:ABC transporter substrate-binding protein [Romboutsia weinsteinii]|uniref:ABC transporter substrate-binding protein n=1 Tax=Romboutsia weinsteinii TaxID=2020949 RepID=A0A371JA26_9FIRM|nr:ABC transporter substrate-binding protein [Romboutsia weinsteinii]RDY29619.1 ABC transporter substrate-binding protein [Romboutsia weinsteinii]
MKKTKVLSMILAIVMMTVGCQEITENNTAKEDSKSAISSENIQLTMVKPETINPIMNQDKSVGYIMNLIYDGLFTIDENYDIVPQMAEEYGLSEDGMSVSIKLKDAKWHDGSEVTAQDVQFSVNLIQNNASSPYNLLAQKISSVSVINNKELTIRFKEKYAFSVDTLIFPIVSKSQLSSSGDINSQQKNLIGNGPYKIDRYEQRSGMILSVNEEYYEELPKTIRNIDVSIVPDEEAQVSMVMALQSDITNISLKDLSKFQEKEFNITTYESRDYESIIFNYDNEFLKDINFRKAILHSINREFILEEGYMEDATLVNFPLNSKSKYYDSDLKPFAYNIEKAKSYLEKAKPVKSEGNEQSENTGAENTENKDIQSNNADNKSESENTNNEDSTKSNEESNKKPNSGLDKAEVKKMISELDLKIIVNKENSERLKTAYLVSNNLKAIGIKSTIVEMSSKEIDAAISEKQYDLAIVGWELSSVPDVRDIIASSGYTDEKLTNYMTSLVNATSENQIKDIYKSIQKHIRDNVAFISLVIRDDYIVTNKRLDGKILPNDFDVYEGISNLKIKNK